jgi:hypothetical protein
MKFRKLLYAIGTLPFAAGIASAATPLGDAAMDRITAGEATIDSLPPITCNACTLATSSSMSQNGVTTSTSSTGTTGGGSSGGGGGGSTGGGSGGGSGGGGTGGGSTGNSSGPPPPGVLLSGVSVPANLAATLAQAAAVTVTTH